MLHVIATGQRRGAELFASDLIRSLNDGDIEQRVAVLRGGPSMPADYDAPTIPLARGGRIPGFRVEMRSAGSLRTLMRAWGPDIVQAHGGEPLKYAMFAVDRSRPASSTAASASFPSARPGVFPAVRTGY